MSAQGPMSPEELKAIIRQCFREEQDTVREAIREELKDAGLVLGDKEDRHAAARDFQFLRSAREKFDSTSSKVGGAIILGFIGGLFFIVGKFIEFAWGQR